MTGRTPKPESQPSNWFRMMVAGSSLLAVLLFTADVPAADQIVAFTVGSPETVCGTDEIKDRQLQTDSVISAINDGGTWKWFGQSRGYLYAIGPKDKPFERVVIKHGFLRNAPDENRLVFKHPEDGKLHPLADYPAGLPNGEKITGIKRAEDTGVSGYWLANVWRDPETGHLLGFYHVETRAPAERLAQEKPSSVYVRQGSAHET